ncbi:MAG: MFS transporter [Gemmataceae bacterium]|nr:MFS transporter [Gemmataceae bacterium]
MWNARFRLASLWASQTARVLADNCLRIFVYLDLARAGMAAASSGWHLVTTLLMAPAIILAPSNGAICNAQPKPRVLILSAAAITAVLGVFLAMKGPWIAAWGIAAIFVALYAPTRYAILPAAANDAKIPLSRVNGWIEMAVFVAVIGGLMLGGRLQDEFWSVGPAPVVLAAMLSAFALLTVLPVRFASDVRRAEPPREAVAGFFRDVRRIWSDREARFSLIGLALLRGMITAMAGAFLPVAMQREGDPVRELLVVGAWIAGGAALGSLLAGIQRHPRRVIGMAPIGAVGMAIGLLVAALASDLPSPTLCGIFGVMAGLVNVPLAATYQADVPADARGNAMAVRNFADNVSIAVMSFALFLLGRYAGLAPSAQLLIVASVAGIFAVVSIIRLRRELLELLIEFLFHLLYRIRGVGPGLDRVPLKGPVMVLANHACWMDPLLLAKVVPRRVHPMMTADFFDIPGMRWLMVHVIQAIRVPVAYFRREAPELKLAIDRLDKQDCLMIFPEGALRRKDEAPLRRFGQGVAHILRERPTTPIVPCWIEGNWGSFFSYKNGPPTKNKRFDFRRRIEIVVGEPIQMKPELLDDQRGMRLYLMQECLKLREVLGLSQVAAPALEEPGEAEGGKQES